MAVIPGGNIDITIVGGGATGVELAAELSRMVELAAGYGEADIRRRLRLILLESAPRILSRIPGDGFRLCRFPVARARRGDAHWGEGRGRRRRGLPARWRRARAGRAQGLGGGHPCVQQLRLTRERQESSVAALGLFRDFLLGLPSRGHGPQALSSRGSIIISLPLGPGRNEFGPAVGWVRTARHHGI
jgi:hypothetical protein